MIVILTHMFVDLGAPLQSAAEDGECERNPTYMAKACARSCHAVGATLKGPNHDES